MIHLSYVYNQPGWCICRDPADAFEWWCGDRDGWVSPYSDYWHVLGEGEVEPKVFVSLDAARAFARRHGWEAAPRRRRMPQRDRSVAA
jgi:hypothetical protein